jgi:flagellar motor switch protein FliG
MSDSGLRKSAILLLSLGEEAAVEVFKFLGPKEVQKLGATMAAIENVNRDEIDEVLKDFQSEIENRASLGASDEYLRSVLTKALGSERANHLLDRILQGSEANNGIEGLKWMDSAAVAELIKNEHPQIIATILVHLEQDQSAEVLSQFVERLRNDVLLRIATLEGVQPSALRELNEVLTQLLSGSDKIKKSAMGGIQTAAEILNMMGGVVETGRFAPMS